MVHSYTGTLFLIGILFFLQMLLIRFPNFELLFLATIIVIIIVVVVVVDLSPPPRSPNLTY